ncbi:MAG: type II/IV secretion system ATPase subunit [Candidatus Thermoplasmatota archaeon]|nr:type II/IV secretion system ATPase subunit [Candidatus Thermoplasmatota archaeon]
MDLDQAVEKNPHLKEYMDSFVNSGRIRPMFTASLTEGMAVLKQVNVIYPVGDPIFIHVFDDEEGRQYHVIEPELTEEEKNKLEKVRDNILELAPIDTVTDGDIDLEKRIETLFRKVTYPVELRQSIFDKLRGKKISVSSVQEKRMLYALKRDLVRGGLIEPLLRDPYLEDIHAVGLHYISVVHKVFGMVRTNLRFGSERELDLYVRGTAERMGRPVTDSRPIVDGALPDGSRMNIIYSEDVSKGGASFTIRKFFERPPTMPQLVKWGTFSSKMAAYLWLCLEYGMSVFVSGETASGKTTTLNAMVPFINFRKKIYSAEDTPEVMVPHEVWQRLITRETVFDEAKVELFDLVKTALRSRPDYIIVGEVRGKEGSAAFQAMQTGHAVLSTFHASSIAKMIQRFTGDPINVPIRFIDNMNLALFQEIVYEEGRIIRRCSAIEEIIKYSKEKGGVLTRTIFQWDPVRDRHYFTGMYNSYILEHKIAPKMGLEFSKDIYTELDRRERVIRSMVESDILGYDRVNAVFRAYSERGWEGIPKELRG